MKAEKIRELDDKELTLKLNQSDEQLFRIQFQMNMGQLEGLKKYRELRKDRARMNTILRERALKAEKEASK
jgi:large subunit ribosomal protein L29